MNYGETLDYLFSQLPMYQRIGEPALKKGLGNIQALCSALGQPQNAYPCIHIAGTNGKGSVTHLIAAVLQASGLSVGVYVSPHYKDFRERIKINGVYISETEVVDFVRLHRPEFERIQPSFFEMTVAMAFEHFSRHRVDVAVIETGLGGRLDSTNIITPLLSVITNIDYDHMALLGNTLPEIAFEKAGIIKPGVPVVVGEEREATRAVFEGKAAQEGSELVFASGRLRARLLERNLYGARYAVYEIADDTLLYDDLELGLAGGYQQANLLTTLQALHVLRDRHYPGLNEQHLRTGLREVKRLTAMMGRWEVLQEKPLVIADSAHNPHGFKSVLVDLAALPHRQLHLVLGVVRDKDTAALFELLPKDALYYCCAPNIPRALPAEDLQAAALSKGFQARSFSSVRAALQAAIDAARDEDLIYVGGSIFVLGEVL